MKGIMNIMTQSSEIIKHDSISCSVIIRTKDRPRLLSRSLTSLAEQNRKPDEIIIVNDGGENIDQVIDAFSELPIIKMDNVVNLGRSRAGNIAVEAAKGDAICFLDDDDRFYQDHLHRLEMSMVKFDAKVAYSGSLLVQQDLLGKEKVEQNKVIGEFNDSFDSDRLKFENYIPLISLLMKRSLFLKIGGFDESFSLFEDWDLLLRLSQETQFYHLNRITTEYAVWGNAQQITLSSNKGAWEDAYKKMFKKHFLPLTGEKKTSLMAGHWLLSQNRRSTIQTMMQKMNEHEEKIWLNESTTETIQKKLHKLEKENEFLHNERQKLGNQNVQLSQDLGNLLGQNEQIKKEMKKGRNSVQELKKMVHEQNKQLSVGLSSNQIRGLMQAQAYSKKKLVLNDILENYQRLVLWVKNRNVKQKEVFVFKR